MKLRIILILTVLSMTVFAFAGNQEFSKGKMYLTPQAGAYSYAPSVGASLEYGLTENIGIGGGIMAAFWSTDVGLYKISETLTTPTAEAYYHFKDIDVDKLDLFGGLSLGYSVYSFSYSSNDFNWSASAKSGFFLSPILGGRYYFSKKIAVCLKGHYSAIGDWSGVGGELGVTFKL